MDKCYAQIRTFARTLCFHGQNASLGRPTPTKCRQGHWREFWVFQILLFLHRKWYKLWVNKPRSPQPCFHINTLP